MQPSMIIRVFPSNGRTMACFQTRDSRPGKVDVHSAAMSIGAAKTQALEIVRQKSIALIEVDDPRGLWIQSGQYSAIELLAPVSTYSQPSSPK
jgi:hypothetical protein